MKTILIVVCLIFVNSLYAEKVKSGNSFIPGHIRVDQIAMVGAHNISTSSKDGWIYSQQSETVTNLLAKYGVRFMKIPLHWRMPTKIFGKSKKPPYIALCHEEGVQNCKLSVLQRKGKKPQPAIDLLKKIATFVKNNPKEIIIIKFESYLIGKYLGNIINGTSNFTDQDAINEVNDIIRKSGLGSKVYKLKGKEWPTLEQLRKSGKTVIIFEQSDSFSKKMKNGLYVSSFNNWMRQTHWDDNHRSSCALYGKANDHRFLEIAINYATSIQKNSITSAFLKALKLVIPKLKNVKSYNYSSVNSKSAVKARVDGCRKHNFAGFIVSSDHVHKGDLQEVVYEYNKKLT